ncbi:MAG: ribonuclease HII [Patescibacteria group bacterium]|nr:ribonuclease HII [Patescibacteria group bacterium]
MIIVGIDEVGRGCWAGPLVAGAVILGKPIPGLADSKVLSAKRRQALAKQIEAEAVAYGLGWVAPAFIDMYGLTLSVQRAMQQALAAINVPYDSVIIDGNYNYLPNEAKAKFLIKADATVAAVSAASILAKVARDQFMVMASKGFPDYGFEKHVGYGTAQHLAALQQSGVSELHRKSFKPVRALLKLATEEHTLATKQMGNHVAN